MTVIALDSETHLLAQGRMAPPVVCVSWALPDGRSGLVHQSEAEAWLHACFDSGLGLVFANAPYDMTCFATTWPSLWPRVWDMYDQDRVYDVLIRQKLQDIANGKYRGFRAENGCWVPLNYSLDAVQHRYTKKHLDKGEDTWRLRYAELENVPLDKWPSAATEYAVKDAETTLLAYQGQEERAGADQLGKWYHINQHAQTRADFWLHLTSVVGIMTSKDAVERLRAAAADEMSRLAAILSEHGLLVNGVKKQAAVRARFQYLADTEGLKLRYTKPPAKSKAKKPKEFVPQIVTDADACLESGDPLLISYKEYTQAQHTFSSECEAYARGAEGLPLHTRFEVLAATGRTTSSGQKVDGKAVGCNTQNVRNRPGVRECFVPRPGYAFICIDYDMAELRALAQVCYSWFGYSRLGELLNAGVDVHLEFASKMLHLTYDQAVERYKARKHNPDEPIEPRTGTPVIYNGRQTGKVNNFGRPGGMGDEKLVLAARKQYGVIITVDESRELKKLWLGMYPEMTEYFRRINSLGRDNEYYIEHLWTKLLRGKIPYCAACNSPFQGLVATMMKESGYLISRACYRESGPLTGCFVVNEVHDEIVIEAPLSQVHDAAMYATELWLAGARPFLPQVPPTAKPVAMTVWSKNAEQCFDSDARLIPWSPKL